MIARILRPLTAATMVILSACSAGSDSTGLDDDTDIDPPADREGPTVVIQSPANGATIDGDLVVSGTASDASGVQSVTVQVNGGSPQAATGTTSWSYAVPVAQSGAYAIVVRATDVRGNASRDANLAVTIPPGWRTMGSVEISGTGTLSIGSVRVGASETDLAIFYEYTRSSLAPLDQGEVRAWTGSGWSVPLCHTNDAHLDSDFAFLGSSWAATFRRDNGNVSTMAGSVSGGCGQGGSTALEDELSPAVAFAMGEPVFAYNRNSRLYVLPAASGLPDLTGGLGQTRNGFDLPNSVGALDVAGDATAWYAAFRELTPSGCISVRKGYRSGGSAHYDWVGPCFFVQGSPIEPRIVMYDGQPTVAWREGSELLIARWNGLEWRLLGSATLPTTSVSHEIVASGSALYVLLSTPFDPPFFAVEKYDGTTWSALPPLVSGATNAGYDNGIAVYKGQPVVAYKADGKVNVKRFVP